jgi:hypothetical protein
MMLIALAAISVAVTVTACSGSPAKAPAAGGGSPAADPLAHMSASQITVRALGSLRTVPAVRISGAFTADGATISLGITVVRGQGCDGTIGVPGKGSFGLIYLGKTVWIKPTDQFYRALSGGKSVPAAVLGKYLQAPPGSGLDDFAEFCDMSNLLGQYSAGGAGAAGLVKRELTTIDGQRALEIGEAGDSAALYVTDTANPRVLRLTGGSGSDTIDFSGYGQAAVIKPPPASEIVDASKYGF